MRDDSIELISHPFTIEFYVLHPLKWGSFGSGCGRSPFMHPNLSFPEIYISAIWDHKV